MIILLKAMYRFSAIPIKLSMAYFTKFLEQNFFNLHGNTKALNSQSSSEKGKWNWKNQAPRLYTTKLQSSRQYNIGTKTNIDQWNRIQSSEVNPHTYGQSMTKEARLYNSKDTFSSINDAGETGKLHVKQLN